MRAADRLRRRLDLKTLFTAFLVAAVAACAPANRDATGTDTSKTTATAAAPAATTSRSLSNPQPAPTATPKPTAEENRPMDYYKDKVAELHTTAGEIDIRFFPDAAPNHVKNFIDLAEKGFYNGTKFHRVIPGFMIQGGDPNTVSGPPSTWGSGGSPQTLKAEFNNIHHARGIVSMARTNDPDSASSQFFICVADSGFLDRQYTVFGQVTKGMDVADKIVKAPRNPQNDRPDNPTTIEKIVIRAAKPDEKGPAPTGR
jgi:cyclophilin family peptidyl-prolyl cis-trans isomerase